MASAFLSGVFMRSTLACLLLLASLLAHAEAPARKDVLKLAARVADWQLAHMDRSPGISTFGEETYQPRSWQKGAFWVGMTHLADATGQKRFVDAILANGRATRWM